MPKIFHRNGMDGSGAWHSLIQIASIFLTWSAFTCLGELLTIMLFANLLHYLQNEARKLNHEEMVEEDRRNKLPANWEARKRKAEWELADQEARKVYAYYLHLKYDLWLVYY